MNFKSKKKPAQVVYESSGIHCQLYSPKKKEKNVDESKKTA